MDHEHFPGLRPILVAEDNEADVELMLIALEMSGVRNPIVIARDGQDALDYLRCTGHWANREPVFPACVILDLKMPRVSGLDVLNAIRDSATLHHIPVIILTASQQERDVVRAYEYGVNAYVVKPIEFSEFTQTVGEIAKMWAVRNVLPPPEAEPLQ